MVLHDEHEEQLTSSSTHVANDEISRCQAEEGGHSGAHCI